MKPGEVVLTFDDGPWPGNTPAVLAALTRHCLKATFFPIGKHATYHPEILRQVAAAGHTIGSHTWSHADLSKKSFDDAKVEIEKGISAVRWALEGAPSAPFFRFPDLKHPPEMVTTIRGIRGYRKSLDYFGWCRSLEVMNFAFPTPLDLLRPLWMRGARFSWFHIRWVGLKRNLVRKSFHRMRVEDVVRALRSFQIGVVHRRA